MKPSFTAHAATADGDHDKVFNFVTPARRWAKRRAPAAAERVKDRPKQEIPTPPQPQAAKAAGEKLAGPEGALAPSPNPAWQWGQQLQDWGYDPAEAQASGMMGDPLWYYRMQPQFQGQGPEFSGGYLAALQARNEALKNQLDQAGTSALPTDGPRLSRWLETLRGGSGATIANAAKGQGYQDALERTTDAVRRANPELSDLQAAQIAQQTLGTEQEYFGELGSKLVSEGAPGPTLEGLAPWFLPAAGAGLGMRALSLPQSLTGRALYYSINPPKTPEEIRESQAINAALEGAQRSKELQSAQEGASPLWAPLWALGGIEKATLGFTGSGIDEGRVDMQRALKTLASGGTSANQILLEQLQRQRDLAQRRRETLNSGAVREQGMRGVSELDRIAQRQMDRQGQQKATPRYNPDTGKYEDPYEVAVAMRKNPYMNLATMDWGLGDIPLMGTMTGEQSARAGRIWDPTEWGSMAKDVITGRDSTHDYMMRADPMFGKERVQGYQGAVDKLRSGKWDWRRNSLSDAGIRVADPGQEAAWYQPASWLGWRVGERSGEDPKVLKDRFEKDVGYKVRLGRVSRQDLGEIERGLGDEGRKAVGWDRYTQDYNKNRMTGLQGLQTDKVGSEKLARARWLAKREKIAAAEAPVPSPDFLQEFYRQQILRRQWLARRQMLPIYSDERRLTDPEQTFGSGLYERTHRMGPGANAMNILPMFQRMMSNQDLAYFDPYVRKQKAKILAGEWQPGMELGPHLQKRQFGWQNPLGAIGRFFGTVPDRAEQYAELKKGLLKSPEFHNRMALWRKGMLSDKEIQSDLGGTPLTSAVGWTPEAGDPVAQLQQAAKRRSRVNVEKTFDFAKDLGDQLKEMDAPMLKEVP